MNELFETHRDEIRRALDRFAGLRVLIVGDVILDEFVWGRVDRISPEAPVPVVEVVRESVHLGGAANVAANLAALGAEPLLLGVAGEDASGERLRLQLQRHGISTEGLITEAERSTSVKTRIIAHHQQVCRTDRESRSPLAPESRRELVRQFRLRCPEAAAVLLSDYAKGVLADPLPRQLAEEARTLDRFVTVDPKAVDFSIYAGASAVTPNQKEAERASGIAITDETSLRAAAVRLSRQCGADSVLITQGEEGMTLLEEDQLYPIPTMAREVFDVTGAGDTVVGLFTLGVAAGLSPPAAALLANLAAGIVVGKLGTASVTRGELEKALE